MEYPSDVGEIEEEALGDTGKRLSSGRVRCRHEQGPSLIVPHPPGRNLMASPSFLGGGTSRTMHQDLTATEAVKPVSRLLQSMKLARSGSMRFPPLSSVKRSSPLQVCF